MGAWDRDEEPAARRGPSRVLLADRRLSGRVGPGVGVRSGCLAALVLAVVACTATESSPSAEPSRAAEASPPAASETAPGVPSDRTRDFGPPPDVPEGPLAPEVEAAVETAFGASLASQQWGPAQADALRTIAESGDPRVAWIVADLMRIAGDPALGALLAHVAGSLLGIPIEDALSWGTTTDHLMAWDVPAPPGYLAVKRGIFTLVVPEWERLFVPGDVDWRHVSWGGVGIDDRPFGQTDDPCSCIPAADDPEASPADDAGWLADDAVVFGLVIGGEARAYPRRIMEVREMVNDTLGGRAIGMPYCTLCGSAQAWFTDAVPEGVERPVLRTSGLLVRSNKLMYDVTTFSVLDTFRGRALTGPLAERGVVLPQASVVTTTWGAWRTAHPETTVLVESLALGRDFDFRNNRDANGPIFPIGAVDPRLPVQEDVLGVVPVDGGPIAFHVASALQRLGAGEPVAVDEVSLVLDGGGLRAIDAEGRDLGSHQAFWFAWSQFHPETRLWPASESGS